MTSNMKRTLKGIAWGAVLFAGIHSIPSTTVYAREDNPLQSYCLMAKADARLGVAMGENVKAICK